MQHLTSVNNGGQTDMTAEQAAVSTAVG